MSRTMRVDIELVGGPLDGAVYAVPLQPSYVFPLRDGRARYEWTRQMTRCGRHAFRFVGIVQVEQPA